MSEETSSFRVAADTNKTGSDDDFRRLLWFLLGASRGGMNRAKIVSTIRERPCNLNQLAKIVGIDYRSVQHHMGILLKNHLVVGSGERYGMVYSIHPWLDHHFATFEDVCGKLGISHAEREPILVHHEP